MGAVGGGGGEGDKFSSVLFNYIVLRSAGAGTTDDPGRDDTTRSN